MTLSPVFRSESAVRLLREEGIWEQLAPAIASQARAVRTIHEDLGHLVDPSFLEPLPLVAGAEGTAEADLPFLQEYFFLILFRALFEGLGMSAERLERYAEINFCVKGTITAADNLFDDQDKSLLPLRTGSGARFMSILQLMCFERLIRRSLDRGIADGAFTAEQADEVLKGLLDLMGAIGRLEGSEEGGVDEIPTPDTMVERVHRVRGGALFALSFIAPKVFESGEVRGRIEHAEPAIARLGTAFQIVDDLTDFEFDLPRRSHNLLVSQIHHHGTEAERAELAGMRAAALAGGEAALPEGSVERVFRASAQAVLERAYAEARAAFRELAALGFWFPEALADEVVHAIVGLEGVRRMEALVSSD